MAVARPMLRCCDALVHAADEGDGFVVDGHFLNIGCRVGAKGF